MHSDEDMLGLLLTEKKELEEGEVTDWRCCVHTYNGCHIASRTCVFFNRLAVSATCFWHDHAFMLASSTAA